MVGLQKPHYILLTQWNVTRLVGCRSSLPPSPLSGEVLRVIIMEEEAIPLPLLPMNCPGGLSTPSSPQGEK